MAAKGILGLYHYKHVSWKKLSRPVKSGEKCESSWLVTVTRSTCCKEIQPSLTALLN